MNRHSIFLKLNILFAVALFATLIAGGSVMLHMAKKDQMELMFKSRLIGKELRFSSEIPTGLLDEFGLAIVKDKEKEKVLSQMSAHPPMRPDKPHERHGDVFGYQGDMYLHLHTPRFNILLRDEHTFWDRFLLPVAVVSGTLGLLFLMYFLLRKTLIPLKALHQDIERYGEGKLSSFQFSDKKDEIAEVSNAFYASAAKTKRLIASRTLFVRNLFHELNTPVTKGKLLAQIVEEPKSKQMLESIFSRLSALLKELSSMEQITSESYVLKKKQIRITDLIDEAKDLLYLDEEIPTNITSQTMEADFASMRIVFKNLIDNGLKYGKNLTIVDEEGKLSFISRGESLSGDFASYLEPFSGKNTHSKEGLGLGLYIVSEALRLHEMDFLYQYIEGENRFTIVYQNNL